MGDTGENARYSLFFPVETTSGAWMLSVGFDTTVAIAFGATASVVQQALEALAPVGSGNVTVELLARGYAVEFCGSKSAQPMPLDANGDNLLPAGEIAVKVITEGARPHFTDTRLELMWDRRSTHSSDLELQYLFTRLDAITELKGITWTQIDQATGDIKRDYEKQFQHLVQLEESTQAVIASRMTGLESENYSLSGQTHYGEIKAKTPSGIPFPFVSGRVKGQF